MFITGHLFTKEYALWDKNFIGHSTVSLALKTIGT